jgi:hypothetical protein
MKQGLLIEPDSGNSTDSLIVCCVLLWFGFCAFSGCGAMKRSPQNPSFFLLFGRKIAHSFFHTAMTRGGVRKKLLIFICSSFYIVVFGSVYAS